MKYLSKTKVIDDIKRKAEQKFRWFGFILTELYEFEFPPVLKKNLMNLENFSLPQQPYQFKFNMPYFELKRAFNDHLKNLS